MPLGNVSRCWSIVPTFESRDPVNEFVRAERVMPVLMKIANAPPTLAHLALSKARNIKAQV